MLSVDHLKISQYVWAKLPNGRAYKSIITDDFSSDAIDFGNFIIPTSVIQSIQKCGDGND